MSHGLSLTVQAI